MKAAVDNVWTSPSTIHFRVLVWYGKANLMKKFECSIPLVELDAVDARHLVLALGQDLFPIPGDEPLPGL